MRRLRQCTLYDAREKAAAAVAVMWTTHGRLVGLQSPQPEVVGAADAEHAQVLHRSLNLVRVAQQTIVIIVTIIATVVVVIVIDAAGASPHLL